MAGIVKIRKAIARDSAMIKSIEIECGLSPWPEVFYEKTVNDGNSIFYIAFLEDKAAGFLYTRLITTKQNSFLKSPTVEAEILNVAVLLRFREQGIGRKLLGKMLEDLLEFESFSVFLEVREENLVARRFYRSNGFVEIGKRRDYYTRPRDNAVLMSLEGVGATGY